MSFIQAEKWLDPRERAGPFLRVMGEAAMGYVWCSRLTGFPILPCLVTRNSPAWAAPASPCTLLFQRVSLLTSTRISLPDSLASLVCLCPSSLCQSRLTSQYLPSPGSFYHSSSIFQLLPHPDFSPIEGDRHFVPLVRTPPC